ncbi:MAG: LLM class F420-dependent oxidoreductase [SAR324 cluster bacterium]|nr:LLM class F420-dependent oxidoreductase [SAR324 cluster bacterium]
MNVGICLLMTDYDFDVIELARKVEALGFESLWAPEHGVIPVEFNTELPSSKEQGVPTIYQHGNINQIADPFVWLGAVAAATDKITLGTGICLVPERDPIHTAKQVATVDRLSQGRFVFGIGAGWLKGESQVFGVDFPRRWSQTRDYVLAMKNLWGNEVSQYQGEFVSFPPLVCNPKPLQQPHPPILIAGEMENVAARIVEYADGWIPRVRHTSVYADPARLEQARRGMEALFRERGRDPDNFSITAWDAPPDRVRNRRYFDAGVRRVVHIVITGDQASALAQLEQLAAAVL